MIKFYTWVTLILLSSISVLKAQVTVTSPNQTYNQDFNSLDSSGSANAFNIAGWEINRETYRAGNGTATNGDIYSFGETNNTDRALGGVISGSISRIYLGASFKNNSSTNLNEFNIQYKGEQWRRGNKTSTSEAKEPLPDTLAFEYSINATGINDAAATWKKASSLNFVSPVVDDSVRGLNGNLASYSKSISGKFNAEFSQNSTIYVRWAYVRKTVGITGSRDGLSVDDFSITFNYDSTWTDTTGVPCNFDVDAMAQITNIENTETSVSIEFNTIQGATGYLITLDEVISQDHVFGYPTDGETYVDGQFIGDTKVIGIVNSGTFVYSNLDVNNNYFITVTPIYECEKSIFYGTEDFIDFTTEEVLPPCEDPTSYAVESVNVIASSTSAEFTFTPVDQAVGYIVFLDTDYDGVDDYDWGFPVDSSTYTAGDFIGASKVVYVGNDTSIVVNGLIPSTTYLLSVHPIFNCEGYNFYGWFNSEEFITPREQIEGCEFVYEQTATITSITNDTSSFNIVFDTISGASSYLITLDYLQSQDHVFGYPTDKTIYNVGDFIDSSQVIGIITNNQFEYSGLVTNAEYFVTVYPIYTCSDTVYYGAEYFEYFVSEQPATPCEDPYSFAVESVSVVPTETSAQFSFTPLEGAIGYIVFLDTDYGSNTYEWGWPVDSVTYTVGEFIDASEIVYVGADTSITVNNLLPNTTYLLSVHPIFSCDQFNTYGWFNSEEFTTTVTSIKETISNNMLIYPNPISGNVLNIKLNNKTQGKAKVQVFNIVGSEVYSEQRNISSNVQLTLPSQLAAGRYTIRIEQDGNFIVGSFAIVR